MSATTKPTICNSNSSNESLKQQQLKYIASVVRALVTSRKPPCFLREIEGEYREVENKPIPFASLGYSSAEQLLRESGQFQFSRIGTETCITAKANTKTNHITSMVRGQKSSKSTRLTQVKQVRQPRRTDQSWNKSSYSTSVYAKSAYIKNRMNHAFNGDRNNIYNNQQSNNRNNNSQHSISSNINTIAAKGRQQQSHQQPQVQQKMFNGNQKQDLGERLNSKLQQQQQQAMPRPILGQNNSSAVAANNGINNYNNNNNGNNNSSHNAYGVQQQQQNRSQQQQQPNQSQQQQQPNQLSTVTAQQLLRKNPGAIANASSLILAQREQQPQSVRRPLGNNYQRKPLSTGGGPFSDGCPATASSVQDRLKIRTNNVSGMNGGQPQATPNSAVITPDSSPAISSAGSEQMQNPFSAYPTQQQRQLPTHQQQQQQQPQPAQFHKQHFLKSPPAAQLQDGLPVIPPKVFQFNPNLDPITSLSQYCVVRRCPPEYNVYRSKYSRLYQCRVEVNGSIFSTYPNEYPNEHLARISCAAKAIEQIKLEEQRRPLPPCTFSDKELTEKLYQELQHHPHGIFAKNIPEWFGSTFQQALPQHWWTLVQSSSKFTTEKGANNCVIVFANTAADDVDSADGATVIQMDGIVLPWKEKYWDLFVTHCVSTVEVWARLFGKEYNERLDSLMNDIELYMLTEKARPVSIVCKHIYLVCISECWHRVRVEDMDKVNGMALCFFIDFGDADWMLVNTLYICEPNFLELPAQAIPLSLFGLEDFAGNPNAHRHLEALLLSKSVVGEVLTKEADFYASDASGPCCDRIQVALYDTSTEQDINLNPVILNKICDDTRPPELKHTGVTNVLVTHINNNGDLYLQTRNNEYVQKLLQTLIGSKFKRDQHKVSAADITRANMFLICDDNSSNSSANWCRGVLAERSQFSPNDEEFDIFCVDGGETRRIHVSQMYRLESLSTALSKFPPQAIIVRLYNIPEITSGIVGRMRALLPTNCEAMVKMVSAGVVPTVTIYRRFEGTDTLCTINDVIRIEHELESDSVTLNADADGKNGPGCDAGLPSPTTSNSFVEMKWGLTMTPVPNSPQRCGELPKLKAYEAIPPLGEMFEVRVAMSANPSNFMIQPYEDYPRLRNLMKDLQDYCENSDEFIPADMVEKGQAYAAKHPDGFYHRVIVEDKFHGDMIHVSYCDFGDIVILSSDKLKTLPAKFRQLPQMAIQAKLHGIVPRDVDWSLGDCIRFRELTVGQKFVSAIKRISHEANTRILELDLIDVSTDEDIFIHQLLLKENRATEDKS